MNKQELMRKMHEAGLNCKAIKYASQFDKGYNNGIAYAINLLDKLDEPEKPVVPQFVADWYEENKGDIENSIFGYSYNWNPKDTSSFNKWFSENDNKPIQTLVNMHQFGYEVEKEKLYTVKFSNNNLGTTYIGIFKKANKIGLSTLPMNDEYSKCYFTESELKELKFWDNPAFEIEEVKGE